MPYIYIYLDVCNVLPLTFTTIDLTSMDLWLQLVYIQNVFTPSGPKSMIIVFMVQISNPCAQWSGDRRASMYT